MYQMPAARVVSLFHTGADETIPQAYRALNAWLGRNGLVSHGPKCEIYWVERLDGSEHESLTEIRVAAFLVADARRAAPHGVSVRLPHEFLKSQQDTTEDRIVER
ncbi:MAG: hypothetical protein DMG38_08285 [Acidobacteria bacterium]|nr:MAG: hypothetical protein DMG38_08285 [Acidobacteriota bacterium]